MRNPKWRMMNRSSPFLFSLVCSVVSTFHTHYLLLLRQVLLSFSPSASSWLCLEHATLLLLVSVSLVLENYLHYYNWTAAGNGTRPSPRPLGWKSAQSRPPKHGRSAATAFKGTAWKGVSNSHAHAELTYMHTYIHNTHRTHTHTCVYMHIYVCVHSIYTHTCV